MAAPSGNPGIDPAAPVVIGGVGGSGTRVVTDILMGLGYFMGDRLNSAHDNLWFRFFLKRPQWFVAHRDVDPDEVHLALALMTRTMTGRGEWPAGATGFILKAVAEQRWRGCKRLRKLVFRKPPDLQGFRGWGWKEPNTYLYLNFLGAHYPGLKYIHTIRHGLDMAFSKTLGQLRHWAFFFDLDVPEREEDIPPVFLEFWIRANRRALAMGRALGPDRFHLLDFDRMCSDPLAEVEALTRFLGVELSADTAAKLAALPRTPSSRGRYRQHGLDAFTDEQIAAVRELGFEVE